MQGCSLWNKYIYSPLSTGFWASKTRFNTICLFFWFWCTKAMLSCYYWNRFFSWCCCTSSSLFPTTAAQVSLLPGAVPQASPLPGGAASHFPIPGAAASSPHSLSPRPLPGPVIWSELKYYFSDKVKFVLLCKIKKKNSLCVPIGLYWRRSQVL